MAKEWILNQANMRWGLTRKSKVGPVAELIRKCAPKNLKDWEKFYLKKAYPKKHLAQLGKILFIKVTDICKAEIEDVSEKDCIDFIYNLVIGRTFDGYQSEIQTIYGQLESALGRKIEPASDAWDRGYNVDYFIKVGKMFIGLQIKPAGFEYITQIINEREQQAKTHLKFYNKFGGRVFYVISVTEGKNKKIYNPEVIKEIKNEIFRLERSK